MQTVISYQLSVIRKFAVLIIFILLLAFLNGCTAATLSPIKYFKNHISQIDGNRCPMYPSCSTYSLEAINKHGSIAGLIMTFDRLMRCGRDEISISETIKLNDSYYCNDPVSNNDFWWLSENQDSRNLPKFK